VLRSLGDDEHRLNRRRGEQIKRQRERMAADGLSQLLDLAAASPPVDGAYAVVVAQWNGFIRQSGVAPARTTPAASGRP